VSPLRGEKPENRPLSNLNTRGLRCAQSLCAARNVAGNKQQIKEYSRCAKSHDVPEILLLLLIGNKALCMQFTSAVH